MMSDRFIVLKRKHKKSWLFDKLEGKIFSLNRTAAEILKLICENRKKEEIKKIFTEKLDIKDVRIFKKDFDRFKSMVESKKISDVSHRKIPPRALRNIQLCLTYRCNLSCRHCYQSNHNAVGYMPLGLVKKALGEISRMHSIESVVLSGGEPFLHKDIFAIFESVSSLLDLGKRVRVCTNGTIFRPSEIRRIDNRMEFFVSLDGSTEKQNRIIRGPGKFRATLRIIESLVNNGNVVIINFVVNRYTWKDMLKICSLGKKLGISRINFLPTIFINKSEAYVRRLIIPREKRVAFLKEKEKIKHQFDRNFFLGRFLELNFLSGTSKRKFPIILLPCPAGTQKCYVEPSGDVVPCYYLGGHVGGNFKSFSMKQIWNFPAVQFERARFPYIVDEEDMPGCTDCEYVFQCFEENFDNVLFSNLRGEVIKEIICYKL
ncbi:MAG: radical SAM protein [Candidatus Omnitrophica bacterium]|nr:radical SAM protein [Candidatus Omnitrophota bacterium]